MGRLLTLEVTIVCALIAIVVSHVLTVLIALGFFTKTLNHSPGPCKVIQANGSEDFALLPDGLVFVSSGLRNTAGLWYDPEIDKRDGKLLEFDFNKPDQDPVELTLKNFDRKGFNPHGISAYQDPSSGQISLFVVNHRPDAQAIEIFDFERETRSLIHRRSVVDDLIWSPNDVYAVGPDSFYVTNDNFFHFESTLMRNLWGFLLNYWLPCNIVFFDGFKAIKAFVGVHPNGIAMDKDERLVFTPDNLSGSIAIFRRRQDNTLEKCQTIPVGSFIDNINLDPVTGNFWVAGMPRLIDFIEHNQKNLSLPSPSQVFTLHPGKPSSSGEAFSDYEVREVYMNDGKEVTGSSSAIFYKDRLLIGSVFKNMVYCEVKFY